MKYLFALLFSVILLSCKQKDDAGVPNEYAASFVKEFDRIDSFKTNHQRKDTLLEHEKWLGLKPLRKGFDSICIRFSYEVFLLPEWVMIELRHDKIKWVAEISRVKNHFNSEKEKVDTMSRIMVYGSPKSGWTKFIDSLFRLRILTLQDDRKVIPKDEYVSANDGDVINVEVATNISYNPYNYSNIELQLAKYWQVANMIAIKDLLYSEFAKLERFDKAIEVDFWKMVEKNRRNMEKKGKESKKIKMQEMKIQEVVNEDTSSIKKKKGR